MRRAVLLLSVLVTTACSGAASGPRPHFVLNVTGVWHTSLSFALPEGDWSRASLTLVQDGRVVTGSLVSRDGVRHALGGAHGNGQVELVIEGLPGTSTCAGVALVLSIFEYDHDELVRIGGRAIGRCYGTVAAALVLEAG